MVIEDFSGSIIGHQAVIEWLQQVITRQRLNHAYIFCGPEHVGKMAVARYILSTTVCQTKNACGRCRDCQQVAAGTHADMLLVKREAREDDETILRSAITVDQVRDLRQQLRLTSAAERTTWALIDDAETLNAEATNSLLKVLEEPASQTVLILFTTALSALPATIVSRCQVVRFTSVPTPVVEAGLVQRGCDQQKARRIAALAFGRPGLALRFMADSELEHEYTSDIAMLLQLGMTPYAERFRAIAQTLQDRPPLVLIQHWLAVARDCLLVATGCQSLIVHQQYVAQLQTLANHWSGGDITLFIHQALRSQQALRTNVQPQLLLEHLALAMPS